MLAVGALVLSGVATLIAAIALRGQRSWLEGDRTKAIRDAVKKAQAKHESAKQIADLRKPTPHDYASQAMSSQLIGGLLVVAVVAFLAYGVYRGRHWSRWGVTGFWILGTFTGTAVGLFTVLNVGASIPAAYKVPSFVAALALLVAVVMVNMKASTSYFAMSRPVPPAGAPPRRGLFGPRPTPGAARPGKPDRAAGKSVLTSSAASRGDKYVDRQRSKKRANTNADAIARGAELARSRAKASKSRRPDR
jgi:hypothetical protein